MGDAYQLHQAMAAWEDARQAMAATLSDLQSNAAAPLGTERPKSPVSASSESFMSDEQPPPDVEEVKSASDLAGRIASMRLVDEEGPLLTYDEKAVLKSETDLVADEKGANKSKDELDSTKVALKDEKDAAKIEVKVMEDDDDSETTISVDNENTTPSPHTKETATPASTTESTSTGPKEPSIPANKFVLDHIKPDKDEQASPRLETYIKLHNEMMNAKSVLSTNQQELTNANNHAEHVSETLLECHAKHGDLPLAMHAHACMIRGCTDADDAYERMTEAVELMMLAVKEGAISVQEGQGMVVVCQSVLGIRAAEADEDTESESESEDEGEGGGERDELVDI